MALCNASAIALYYGYSFARSRLLLGGVAPGEAPYPRRASVVHGRVQVLAAKVAGLPVIVFKSDSGVTAAQLDIIAAFLAELAFTFALACVVLNVATAEATSGNSYFGLAIGSTVLVRAPQACTRTTWAR